MEQLIESEKINAIVTKIAQNFNPEKIILFGSYAGNIPNSNSDLDLLIIKETDVPKQYRSFDIHKMLIGSMIPIDILVFSKKEFEEEKSNKYSFLTNALKTSKLLYERKG